jgi:carboxymethylenebutenolidase
VPELVEETIACAAADGEMSVLVRRLPGQSGPPAIVFHDGPGIRPAVEAVAGHLARAGYLALVPELYYRVAEPRTFDPRKEDETERMMAAIASVIEGDVVADVAAVLAALRERSWATEGAVCVGFCMGAAAVLETMAAAGTPFHAGAAFHPSFCVTEEPGSPHLKVRAIEGDIYVGFGEADEVSTLAENGPLLDELSRLGERALVEMHPDAGHGFMMPGGRHYDAAAAARSWASAEAIFASRDLDR